MKSHIKTEFYSGMWPNVVFILGWGVRIQDTGVKWFADKAAVAGWNLLIIQLPHGFSSFSDLLLQINARLKDYPPDVIISFSMGSLFALHLEAPTRIFLSPYWGIPKHKLIRGSYRISYAILSMLRGITLPVLPRGFTNRDIGSINVSKAIPEMISPATMWQVINAQASLPKVAQNDHIFYCPDDTIIDTTLCHTHHMHLFQGGHDFLCTPDRESVFTKITHIVDVNTGK